MTNERNARAADSSKLWARIQAIPQSRFPRNADYDRTAHAYKKSYVRPTAYPIAVSACTGLIPTPPIDRPRDPGRGDDPPDGPVQPLGLGHQTQGELKVPREIVAWRWSLEQVGGGTIDSTETFATAGPNACRARLIAPGPGRYRVHLTLELTTGKERAMRSVQIRQDRLVVSVGDSYASGEGNPDRPRSTILGSSQIPDGSTIPGNTKPEWVEPKAHRSYRSGPAFAARDWEDRAEGDLVSFLSFATTGAEIEKGLLRPQKNWQTVGQLEEARRTVGKRPIDALLISIGGNDVGFSTGLKELAFNIAKSRSKTVAETEKKIEALGERFDRLVTRVDALNPKHVFITEYPVAHFDRRADGTVGSGCGILGGISTSDAKEIKRLGTLLNRAVETAAKRHGWTFVDGIAEDFTGHGYCRGDEKYFVTYSESTENQGNIKGTLHPNENGHRVYADQITAALRREVRTRSEDDSERERTPIVRDHRKDTGDRSKRESDPIVRDHRTNRSDRRDRGSDPRVRDHRTNRSERRDDQQARNRKRSGDRNRRETGDRHGNVRRR
ncbi:SGNH/GDSL hydrolase family protein [Halalkalicoccus sp. NIPERK01]|uniref:SGNH/GDSL hydrolase family protein n=1 Tax=Halalkalicoccus sp. NIPERK01 TaxID=3053469 RepID=UPI00256F3CEC|nr:GDSL-type esterase/lipase family protein [Halalkalicoccus sp. NIPERK01]MDL5363360.1 GDSL-type esterase/lipase family protein [Halalkalicoccus sp. NIPERK01]